MRKVLYISNIEVPYRVKFFNELAKQCELTVLYERKESSNRNKEWSKSISNNYDINYLNGLKIKNEYSLDLKIIKYIFNKKYNVIILGCYNSPIQMLAIFLMKLFRKKYYLNLDGEVFVNDNNIKSKIKRFFLKGANKYLVAGKKSAESVKKITNSDEVYPYFFSSLTQNEIAQNVKKSKKNNKRDEYILSIGQYFDYKGLDIFIDVARKEPNLKFKIIGTGNRTDKCLEKIEELHIENIELIPFLAKEELENEYLNCRMLVLPSRQECWGLVVNEAASYGTPIVSTYGSGAAVEFLNEKYAFFLAKPNNSDDLKEKINKLLKFKNLKKYEQDLLEISSNYNIEKMVQIHMKIID